MYHLAAGTPQKFSCVKIEASEVIIQVLKGPLVGNAYLWVESSINLIQIYSTEADLKTTSQNVPYEGSSYM